MGEIATYKCSNNFCVYVVRLSRGINDRTELLCHGCMKVVAQAPGSLCPSCDTELHLEPLNRTCPRCKAGVLTMPLISILS